MRALLRPADAATVRVLDGLVFFWVLLWAVIAGWTGYEIWQLSQLGTTVAESGRALDGAGRALENIGQLPVVGDGPGEFGEQVRATAASIQESGLDARANVRRLAVLLTLSIFIIPTTPVAGLYLPLRVGWRREVSSIRRTLAAVRDDPDFTAFLANRALINLPYPVLREASQEPWRDIERGRTTALADLELTRLGLRPPARYPINR